MKQIVNNNVKLEPLGGGVEIFVSDQHPFGTDAILLANFANPKRPEIACDMGTGCGIIPMLWCRYDSPKQVFALELQENATQLLTRSVVHNKLESRITVLNQDLRELEYSNPLCGTLDLVTMNPPYKPANTGFESEDESQRIARHEVTCTIEDTVVAAKKLLKHGGRLCLCHRPERLVDIIATMRAQGIEPKKVRLVTSKTGEEPFLVLIEGKKGAKSGLRVLPELTVRNHDNTWTQEMSEIYGDYGESRL